jgi:hypothetical protein
MSSTCVRMVLLGIHKLSILLSDPAGTRYPHGGCGYQNGDCGYPMITVTNTQSIVTDTRAIFGTAQVSGRLTITYQFIQEIRVRGKVIHPPPPPELYEW